jgi:hypothetical protein
MSTNGYGSLSQQQQLGGLTRLPVYNMGFGNGRSTNKEDEEQHS